MRSQELEWFLLRATSSGHSLLQSRRKNLRQVQRKQGRREGYQHTDDVIERECATKWREIRIRSERSKNRHRRWRRWGCCCCSRRRRNFFQREIWPDQHSVKVAKSSRLKSSRHNHKFEIGKCCYKVNEGANLKLQSKVNQVLYCNIFRIFSISSAQSLSMFCCLVSHRFNHAKKGRKF